MKKKGLIFRVSALAALLIFSLNILAQGGHGRNAGRHKGFNEPKPGNCHNLPGLTDEQKESLSEIAKRCPVYRTLTSENRIIDQLGG